MGMFQVLVPKCVDGCTYYTYNPILKTFIYIIKDNRIIEYI